MTTEDRQPSGATPTLNRARLGKVLALMASPVDGEALAATLAMVRMLSEVGMRPEDLADGGPFFVAAHATPAHPPRQPQPTPSARQPCQPKPAPPPSIRDLPPSHARRVLASLLAGNLAEDERAFVAEMAEQMRVAPHKVLSTAQVRRLNRLWRAAA